MQQFKQQLVKVVKPGDGKYFTNTTRGEDAELKFELRSDRKDKKTEAVKKVIANMTMGKDVSSLFTDVVNCMQTNNVELKKLVYLYLLSNAKSQPESAIMAVNTFIRDCDDPNPLIRASAIRTMGAIQVPSILDQFIDPLNKSLNDSDPYVRKTAALCVPKLFKEGSEHATDSEYLMKLKELLCDPNPMVLANTVAAITEITPDDVSWVRDKLNKLLTALNDCTEWGQVVILDVISKYLPSDPIEAQSILDRISPRLCHANPAVVLSCINVFLKLHGKVAESDNVLKRIKPPLITLLSSQPEIQYVTLREISLLLQKYGILDNDVKVFFVKYNDPIYVKLEKLDILIRLTNSNNVNQVLAELREYSNEVDVVFVRKSVRAVGRCAIKIESSADLCVKILTDLIETKVNYVVQEAVVVIKDIFRKYPNQYEKVISILCDNLESLDEPEAKASIIFIVGEYAERIDNAGEILQFFLNGFADDNAQVQLQLLTAIVKLFLKRPSDTQDLVQSVLEQATQASDNPDLRDRGYIYWRLLSADPATAKFVVLAEKPLISEETDMLEPSLLETLLNEIPNLSSVCHQPASSFVERRLGDYAHLSAGGGRGPDRAAALGGAGGSAQAAAPTVIPSQDVLIGDLLQMEGSNTYQVPPSQRYGLGATPALGETPDLLGFGGLDDLLPSVSGQASPQLVQGESNMSTVDALADIFGGLNPFQSDARSEATFYEASPTVWLDRTGGLEVQGTFVRQPAVHTVVMKLILTNYSLMPMTSFAIQFSGNSFGLAPAQPLPIQTPLLPRQSLTVSLPLTTSGQVIKMDPCMRLQVIITNNVCASRFICMVPLHVLFVEDGNMEKRVFLATWKDISSDQEKKFTLAPMNLSADTCSLRLKNNNIFTVASRSLDGNDMLYLSMKANNIWILAELKIQPDSHISTLAVKSRFPELYEPLLTAVTEILKN